MNHVQEILAMKDTRRACKLHNMNTIGSRIQTRIDELGLNLSELARRLGVSPQSVQQWVKNQTSPRGKRLDALERELVCSKEWLLFGNSDEPSRGKPSQTLINIPVLNVELAAGNGISIDTELVKDWVQIPQEFLWNGINQNSLVVVSVSGDSMLPRLHDKDQLLIDTSDNKPVSGKVYAIATDEELRVKRLHKRTDGSWIISSDNKHDPAYQDEIISHNNFERLRIIGRAVKVLMGDL
jgi:phage repressor protein C with HTH and peptisase S24 domain